MEKVFQPLVYGHDLAALISIKRTIIMLLTEKILIFSYVNSHYHFDTEWHLVGTST